jgi:hypothetical protein
VEELIAAHTRQADVEQDELRGRQVGCRKSIVGVDGVDGRETGALDRRPNEISKALVVVDDENLGLGRGHSVLLPVGTRYVF